MLEIIETLISPFRYCFKRLKTFKWFTITVVALMLRGDHLGATSVIRDLALHAKHYESLIHFFHSVGYSIVELRKTWYQIIAKKAPLYKVAGRVVIAGDGVKQCKEAFRMPGVKKMVQESETCSKPEYIHGHLWGAVSVLIGNEHKRLSLPLKVNLQDGLRAAASWKEAKGFLEISSMSHVEQMIEAGFEAAKPLGKCFFLMDRYFLTKSALKLLNEHNASSETTDGNKLELVTKARCNCTAFRHPRIKKNAIGRRPKRGKAVKLEKLFSQRRLFTDGKAVLYGEEKNISYYCHKYLWGQGIYQELLFVLVECDGMRSILVSTDTALDPITVIELYSLRFGIESLFREFKQQVGGFSYHFWTSSLPKLNHFAKKGDPDPLEEVTKHHDRMKVLESLHAIEMFVFCSTVAIGILQIISLREDMAESISNSRYLRTRSKKTPSEGTVMYYLRNHISLLLAKSPNSFITQYIREKQIWQKYKTSSPNSQAA